MSKTIWAIIVIIIIVVGGWFIYQSMSSTAAPATTTTTTTDTTGTAGAPATTNSVFMTSNDPTKGAYMADLSNKTLYTFDKDTTPNQSSCTGTCATAWPPYMAPAGAANLPTGISVITRPDGTSQYAYNGKPLYYYALDTASGQLNGDGVGGTWHIIQL